MPRRGRPSLAQRFQRREKWDLKSSAGGTTRSLKQHQWPSAERRVLRGSPSSGKVANSERGKTMPRVPKADQSVSLQIRQQICFNLPRQLRVLQCLPHLRHRHLRANLIARAIGVFSFRNNATRTSRGRDHCA